MNDPKFRNENRVADGMITIPQMCFTEPETHEKLKKMSSGRKGDVIKYITIFVDYEKMLEEGLIKIENCANCWEFTDDKLHIDVLACHILFHIFRQYQEEGKWPDYISYNV